MNAKNPPYTAQSCREEAAINDKFGDPIMNDPDLLRAHADALEENARLTKRADDAHGAIKTLTQIVFEWKGRAERAEAELAKLRQLVAQQAEDDGLWFNAATAPEAYLQQELRKLHAAVEETK